LALENSGGALTTYTWDGENRQVTVVAAATETQTNTYDGDGHRVKRQTATETTLFVRDGQNVPIETDEAGATTASYVNSPGYWGGLTTMHRGGEMAYYGFDLSSNTRQLTDSGGGLLAAYLYDAFGVELWEATYGAPGSGIVPGMSPGFGGLTVPTGPVVVNPLGFSGEVGAYQDAAERVDMRARVYVPGLGRWPRRDPLWFDGGDWNLYIYVGNEPLGRTDPVGDNPAGARAKRKPKTLPVTDSCTRNRIVRSPEGCAGDLLEACIKKWGLLACRGHELELCVAKVGQCDGRECSPTAATDYQKCCDGVVKCDNG
jgi:RHS repeat-associated protein